MAQGVVASAVRRPVSLNRTRFSLTGRPLVRVGKIRAASTDEVAEEGPAPLPLPEGATQPKRIPDIPPGRFGFVEYAERLNSRVAMIGFVGILIVELIANQGILQLAGFDVGSGLGFEF